MKAAPGFVGALKTEHGELTTISAIAEVFRIGVGVAEIIADKNRRLAGQFETLPALVASHQVIQPHHVGTSLRKLPLIFLADSARQFSLLPADLPAHGSLEFTAAARANQLYFPGLLFFGVKRAFVHN